MKLKHAAIAALRTLAQQQLDSIAHRVSGVLLEGLAKVRYH
jgi:hypothetical protein|eukprot:COSAG01_NODE_1186_length_11341_cov_3.330635_17_plen_41_part_00